MDNKEIAVLLTCHNRNEKTLTCLDSFYNANKQEGYSFDIYLVDDGSTDGTGDTIKQFFPAVNYILGNGKMFWAGGMRLAWKTALKSKDYYAFLLLNDDVILYEDFLDHLIKTEEYAILNDGRKGIYTSATIDNFTNKITYGGEKIETNHFVVRHKLLIPKEYPQKCELTNANILWISKETVDIIGVFDMHYTHGIADFDYSLRAIDKGIPVYLAPNVGGICVFDHGLNWKSNNTPLKERISFLKSPKGLAYREYLYYIKKHFPLFLPYSFIALWLKTLFPFIWDRFKT